MGIAFELRRQGVRYLPRLVRPVPGLGREVMMEGFAAIFEDLDDPRTGNSVRHDLLETFNRAA
jgi:hypothetical protein